MAKLRLPRNNNIKIDGKSVYTLYLQLKNHFNGRRDVIKSDWRMKVSDDTYNKRKDKMFFERLSRKFTLKELCFIFIGNMLSNEAVWIGEISDTDPIQFYKLYISRLKLLKSRFEDDLKNIYYTSKKLNVPLKKIWEYNESHISYLFKMLQSNIISYETFLMLDNLFDIINSYDKHDNIVWQSYSNRLNGYKKIFVVDVNYTKATFIDVINNIKY